MAASVISRFPAEYRRAWIGALRLPTLPAAVVPVLVGSALAAASGSFSVEIFVAVLAAALLIQIGTNLSNDYFDHRNGADTGARQGPVRGLQSGLLSAREVVWGAAAAFGLASIPGLFLVWIGGWPILAIGIAAIASGVAYTGGPWPFGYHGLGDLFVFVFFGLAAVVGTCYLHTGSATLPAFALSLPVAALVTAILVVNNLRDIPTDTAAGKRTLAVILGAEAARLEYALLVIGAYALMPLLWLLRLGSGWLMLPWLALPEGLRLAGVIFERGEGQALNPILRQTARLHLLFGILLALGLLL